MHKKKQKKSTQMYRNLVDDWQGASGDSYFSSSGFYRRIMQSVTKGLFAWLE